MKTIPRGEIATYGAVARRAGLPGRSRLVGYALKVAPGRLRLPWFRVLGAGNRISLPPRSRAHAEQARKLRGEGHTLKGSRVVQSRPGKLDELLWKPR